MAVAAAVAAAVMLLLLLLVCCHYCCCDAFKLQSGCCGFPEAYHSRQTNPDHKPTQTNDSSTSTSAEQHHEGPAVCRCIGKLGVAVAAAAAACATADADVLLTTNRIICSQYVFF